MCVAAVTLLTVNTTAPAVAAEIPPKVAPPAVELRESETDARAILLEDRRELDLYWDGSTFARKPTTTDKIRRRVYIVDEAGLDWAEVQINYTGSQWINDLEARTIRPDGTVVPVPPASIIDSDLIQTAGTKKQSWRAKTFAFQNAGPGCIVEYSYEIKQRDWPFAMRHLLAWSIPVREAIFSLDVSAKTTLHHESQGFGEPTIEGNKRTWRLTDVPAPRPMVLAPPLRDWAPWVAFAIEQVVVKHAIRDQRGGLVGTREVTEDIFPDWSAVGQAMFASLVRLTSSTLEIERPAGSDREAVEWLWSEIQGRLDNRAGLPMGAARSVSEVYNSGFGSPHERALVMMSLLRRWDIPNGFLLMPDVGSGDVTESFATPSRLDDLLLWVRPREDSTLLLDPACLGCAAGELAVHHQDRAGLTIIDRDEAEKWQLDTDGMTASTRDKPAVLTQVWRTETDVSRLEPAVLELAVTVTERGLIAQSGKWTAKGNLAASVRHYFAQNPLTEAGREERMREKYLDGVEEGSVTLAGVGNSSGPIEVTMTDVLLRRGDFVQAGPWLMVAIRSLQRGGWMEALQDDRSQPVFFDEQPGFEHRVVFSVPDGYRLVSTPAARSLSSPVGSYELKVQKNGGEVVLTESLHLSDREFAGDAYQNLTKLLGDVRDVRRQVLLFEKR